MADVINLRRAHKAKDRDAREREAAEKRRRFGLTRVEKEPEAARRERALRAIDGHRRDPLADKD